MKNPFKVGDKVRITIIGYGCGPDKLGTITEILEVSDYARGNKPCARLLGIENSAFDHWIGVESFILCHESLDNVMLKLDKVIGEYEKSLQTRR